jgi:hypothetical protein
MEPGCHSSFFIISFIQEFRNQEHAWPFNLVGPKARIRSMALYAIIAGNLLPEGCK